MMDPTFLNLSRSNRLERQVGLVMAEGHAYKFPNDYTYVEIPLLHAENADGEPVDKATRNQAIELVAACTVKPQYGSKLMAVINPALFKYGMAPSILMLDEVNKEGLTDVRVPVTFRKDMNLTGLDWLVRIYLFR